MAKTEEYLQEFVAGVQSALGGNLVSAILYGSFVRGESYSPESDLNVLVVLKEFSLKDLSSLVKIIRRGQKKARIAPIFWTEEDLGNSTDVFPVEFLEMMQHHKVLYGTDVLSGVNIDTKNLLHQIEFELRSKVLRLRGEWINFSDSPKAWADILIRAGTSLMVLFQQAQKMASGKLEASLVEPYRRCVLLKKGDIKLDREEMVKLYQEVHDSTQKIIQVLDKI